MELDLTLKDRIILSNQFRILEKLYPDEAEHFEQHRKALENGYELNYGWIAEYYSAPMPRERCELVLDILQLYRCITNAFVREHGRNEAIPDNFRFDGFDGNEETDYYSYAKYLILDLQRYSELKYGQEYPDYNSHCPMLPRYRSQLATWNQIKNLDNKYSLTFEQAKSIIEVR